MSRGVRSRSPSGTSPTPQASSNATASSPSIALKARAGAAKPSAPRGSEFTCDMASARSAMTRRKAVACMLKTIHARKSREACGRKAGGGGGQVGVDATRSGREDGARRVRRDAGLHGIPARSLAPDQDEQRDRAHQSRDQEEDEGRRNLPGRQLGPHAQTMQVYRLTTFK